MKTRNKLAEHISNAIRTTIIVTIIGFGFVCFTLGQIINIISPRRF